VWAIRGPYWGYGLLVGLTARAQSDGQIRMAISYVTSALALSASKHSVPVTSDIPTSSDWALIHAHIEAGD